jgi:uncharacterized membrane protein
MSACLAMSRPEWFSTCIEVAAMTAELVGIVVIVVGGLLTLVWYAREFRDAGVGRLEAYGRLRRRLGRAILLGLEFLVAADIIATVMIDPTLRSVTSLGLVVLIRTFLSWSLEVELEGRWPWQGKAAGGDVARPTSPSGGPPDP